MVNPNPNFLSKRVKRRNQSGITSDRYQFLGLDQAEPDLGDPIVGPSSVGVNPYVGAIENAYILVADSTGSGRRYWTKQPNVIAGGVVNPGSITVRRNGQIVGAANRITDINFVGSGVTIINPASWSGAGSSSIDIDISVVDVSLVTGQTGSVPYKNASGFIQGSPDFIYNPTNTRVGIGSTLPRAKLDVAGNVLISGMATVGFLSAISGNFVDYLKVGNFEISDSTTFVTIISGSVGIGSTQPKAVLDVNGNTNISGIATITRIETQNIRVSSASSFGSVSIGNTQVISSSRQLQNISSLDAVTTATIENAVAAGPNTFADLNITGISTLNTLGVLGLTTTRDFRVTGISTLNTLGVSGLTTTRDLQVTGISTLNTLGVSGLTTTRDLQVTGISTLNTLGVSGLTTTRDLLVTGVTTVNNFNVNSGRTVSIASSVGIGTTNARYNLDVNGNIRLTGTFVVNNGSGSSGQVLISNGNNPPNWTSPSEVTVGSATSVTTFDRNGISTSYYITFVEKTSGNQSILLDSNNLTYNPSTNTLIVDAISTKNIEVEGLSRITTGVITTSSKNEVIVDNLNTTLFRSARYNIQVNTIGQLSLSSTTSVSGLNSGTNYYPGTYNNIELNSVVGSGTDARANITVSPQATLPIVGAVNGTFTTSGSLVGIGTSQSVVFTQTIVPGPYENSRVTDITLTNVGSGYTSIPTFNFSSPIIQGNPVEAVGVGSTARGIVSSMRVSNIIFNNVGFITTLVPTVTISPSSGTTATSNVSYGISTILVTDNGIGYLSIPTVQFSSGSAVAGVSTIFVNKIRVTNPGFGYTIGDLNTSFVFSSGITSATNNSFSLPNSHLGFTITNPGFGYTAPPILTVASPQIGINTGIVQATLGISTVNISQPGSGYTVSPSFTVEPSVTNFSAYVGAGVSSSGIQLFGGGGYDNNPTISFTPIGGIGTGAQAEAQINISGQVESITITNPGFGYTVPPLVVFSGGTPEVSAAATIRTLISTNFVVRNIGFGANEVPTISIGSKTVEFLDNSFTKTGTVGIATTSRVDDITFSPQGTLSIASTTIISGISTFSRIIRQKSGNVDTINDITITGIDTSNVSVGFAVTGNFVQVGTLVASISGNDGGTIGLTTNLTNPSVGFGLTFFISDTLSTRVIVGQGVSGPNINLTESGTTVVSIGNSSVTLSRQTLNSGIQTSTFNFGTLTLIPGVFQTNVITGISTSGISTGQRIIGNIIQSNTNISAVGVGSITIDKNTTNTSTATTTFTLFNIFTAVGTGASAIASMGIGRVTTAGFGTGYITLPGIAITASDGVTGGGGIVTTSSFGIDTDCIRVTTSGIYNSTPSILITPPKNGSGSAATADVGIGISTIIVSSPGSYTETKPTISFSGGSALVSAAATVNNIILNNVLVVNSGSGYTSSNLPVTATFSNVSLGATVGLSVENITLTSSGLGYTTTPSISFSLPNLSGGVSAAATATLANFGSSFNILPGPGYGNTFVYYIEPITNNTFRLYRNINRTNQITIGFSTVGNPNALVGGIVSNVSINQSGSGYQNGNILSASSVSLGNTFSSNVGTGFSFTVSNTVQNYQISDLMLLQSVGSANTSADIIEYGSISNLESLIDFTADISGSNARLKVTPRYNNNTIKISRTSITL